MDNCYSSPSSSSSSVGGKSSFIYYNGNPPLPIDLKKGDEVALEVDLRSNEKQKNVRFIIRGMPQNICYPVDDNVLFFVCFIYISCFFYIYIYITSLIL